MEVVVYKSTNPNPTPQTHHIAFSYPVWISGFIICGSAEAGVHTLTALLEQRAVSQSHIVKQKEVSQQNSFS